MWQSHWQPRRNPLSHNDLRCVDYLANPGKVGKVGKELDGELTRTVRFQDGRVRKCRLVPLDGPWFFHIKSGMRNAQLEVTKGMITCRLSRKSRPSLPSFL